MAPSQSARCGTRRPNAANAYAAAPPAAAGPRDLGLFLARRFRSWRKAKVEVARLERILVGMQRRIVRRHRHRKAVRQPSVEQARPLELVEARQVRQRLQPEMREEAFGGPVGERTSRHLAAAARADPACLQED